MSCSYCKTARHNILTCEKAIIDRCVSIFQSNTDPLYGKRHRQVRNFSNSKEWFKDEQGKFPHELEWDWESFTRSRIGWARCIDPEVGVIYLIRSLRCMLPGYPLQDGYPNINYVIRSYYDRNQFKCVKISFDVSSDTSFNDHCKLNMECFEDDSIAKQKYQEYLIALRQLREKRMIFREQEKEKRKFDSLVFNEKAIESDECPICMKEFGETNHVVLRCGHQFCGDCIFHHIQTSNGSRCPCCRQEYTLKIAQSNPYHY